LTLNDGIIEYEDIEGYTIDSGSKKSPEDLKKVFGRMNQL
jgi:hypothetical protein